MSIEGAKSSINYNYKKNIVKKVTKREAQVHQSNR